MIPALIIIGLGLYAGSLRHPPVFDDTLLSEGFLRACGTSTFRFDLRWLPYASFGWTFEVGRAGVVLASLRQRVAARGVASMLLLARLFAADAGSEMTMGLHGILVLLLTLASLPAVGQTGPGDHKYSLEAGTLKRNYIVHVPPRAAAGRPLPVVLNFHGGGGNAENQKWYSRMDAAADRDGYIAVYPNGTGGIGGRFLTWNAGTCCGPAAANHVDDVGFVLAVLEDLARRLPYDRSRVYATGLSNGSMMAYRVAAELPERIAAVAGVAGAMTLPDFAPRLPVPVMHIHSVDDQRAFYNGGLGPAFPLTRTHVLHQSVDSMIEKWRTHDGCPSGARADAPVHGAGPDAAHTATRYRYGPCHAGSEVVLWKLTGAGHVWPGGRHDYLPLLLGPGTAVIDANREMWQFFSRFRRG